MEFVTKNCAAMGCTKAVSSDFLMCRRHWKMVERTLQEEIWEAHHAKDRAQHLTLVARATEIVRSQEIADGRRCRSCDEPIFFALSVTSQRPMPIDAVPVDHGNVVVRPGKRSPQLYAKIDTSKAHEGEERYTSHFATCAQADHWRRELSAPKKEEGEAKEGQQPPPASAGKSPKTTERRN